MPTEGARKTWRWITMVAALVILLPMAPSAWQRFRPLNEAERRLVGSWRDVLATDDLTVLRFRADRTWSASPLFPVSADSGFRFQIGEPAPGCTTRSVSGIALPRRWKSEVSMADFENLVESLTGILSGGRQAVSNLEFDGPDRMSIAGHVYDRFDERPPELQNLAPPPSERRQRPVESSGPRLTPDVAVEKFAAGR